MTLRRESDAIEIDGGVEVLMWDEDRKIVALTVAREAPEDYAARHRLSQSNPTRIFFAHYDDMISAADKVYARQPRPKPSRIIVTSKDLNG